MIDIIVTFYNNPHYLDACLRSIAEQTYKNFKVFIVDDCSPESPSEVISKWHQQLPIEYFRSDANLGSAKQFTSAYANTSSEFVVWLHHDDFWHPTFLEQTVKNGLLKRNDCCFAYSLYRTLQADVYFDSTEHLVPKFAAGPNCVLFHVLFSNWIQHSFSVFRRDAFDAVGGYERFLKISSPGVFNRRRLPAGDSYMWARLSTVGCAYVVDERLGTRRIHAASASATNRAVHLEEVILFNQQVFADTDLFSDMARYFSLLVVQTRILNKGRLFDAAVELFDRSLFSEPGFYSKAFHGLKLKLLETICRVLNDFNYDFTATTRPILSQVDLDDYERRITDMRND